MQGYTLTTSPDLTESFSAALSGLLVSSHFSLVSLPFAAGHRSWNGIGLAGCLAVGVEPRRLSCLQVGSGSVPPVFRVLPPVSQLSYPSTHCTISDFPKTAIF